MPDILVVDDEQEIADLVELYLKNEGYTLYKCYDGAQALEQIAARPFDLAILDVSGEVLGKLMSSGHSVKLKGIGTFYYTCRSEGTGVDTPEEVSPAQITAVQIRFIPEYYRGQCGQVTERTLLSPHIEWVDAEGED